MLSYVRCARAALPHLRASDQARIVNVASTSGKRPSTGMPDYSVTKAAVLSFSRLLADAHAREGILVNAVCPGPTLTPAWLAPGGLADQNAERAGSDREAALAAAGAGRPLGRLAEPERDRGRDRISVLGPRELRHRRGLERRRRHRADHHLATPRVAVRTPNSPEIGANVVPGRDGRFQ